jgi:hypothetical protein
MTLEVIAGQLPFVSFTTGTIGFSDMGSGCANVFFYILMGKTGDAHSPGNVFVEKPGLFKFMHALVVG